MLCSPTVIPEYDFWFRISSNLRIQTKRRRSMLRQEKSIRRGFTSVSNSALKRARREIADVS